MDPTFRQPDPAAGRKSLVAVMATALCGVASVLDGPIPPTVALAAAGLGLPLLAYWRYTRTQSRLALWAYVLVSAWVVVAFGLVQGWWHSTLKLYLAHGLLWQYAAYFSWRPVRAYPLEAAGILASVACLYAIPRLLRFLREAPVAEGATGPRIRRPALAAAAMLAMLGVHVAAHTLWVDRKPPIAQRDTIRIGVIVPRSGPVAALGTAFVDAVQMAHDDLPGTKHRYELVVADAGSNPVQAQEAMKKLLAEQRVDALVGGISLLGQLVQPFANQAHVPHLCVCTVPSIGDNRYNFTNIPLAQDEAARWTAEARRRGIRTVALLTQDYPSIDGHLAAMKAQLPKDGLSIVHQARFPAATSDFAGIVGEAKTKSPDVYFIEAPEPALSRLAAQLRAAGVDSIASVVAPSVSEQPELLEGAWYTDSNLVDPGLKERFVRDNPGKPFPTHMVPYAYDSYRLLVQGFERDGDVAAYLRGLTAYDGKAGHVTKQPGTGNFRSTPAVWTITNGRPVLLAQSS